MYFQDLSVFISQCFPHALASVISVIMADRMHAADVFIVNFVTSKVFVSYCFAVIISDSHRMKTHNIER